jgi:hypothetical protein
MVTPSAWGKVSPSGVGGSTVKNSCPDRAYGPWGVEPVDIGKLWGEGIN